MIVGVSVRPVAVLSRLRSSMAVRESNPRSAKVSLGLMVVGSGWPRTAVRCSVTSSVSSWCAAAGVSSLRRSTGVVVVAVLGAAGPVGDQLVEKRWQRRGVGRVGEGGQV